MIIGRAPAPSGAIKIKKNEEGVPRVVSCECCDPCSYLPDVCLEGFPHAGWYYGGEIPVGDSDETRPFCETFFPNILGCGDVPPILNNFAGGLCGEATQWVLILAASGGDCLGNTATNFYCKDDGIDSPIGTYSGINYGSPDNEVLSFTVTERQEDGTC